MFHVYGSQTNDHDLECLVQRIIKYLELFVSLNQVEQATSGISVIFFQSLECI